MHALTSSIFLPAYLSRLPPSLRRALLRRYILEAFHTALARGRPSIDPELIMSYDLYPTINTEGSEDALKKLVKGDKALGKGEKEERNAWLSLVESAMVYPGTSLLFVFITFFSSLSFSLANDSYLPPIRPIGQDQSQSPRDHLIIV